MISNYLLIAFRNLQKNKIYAFINSAGMAVAITSILLIFIYVRNELTYDGFHQNINRIVVLGEQAGGAEKPYYQSVFPALPSLLNTYPAIENGTRIFDGMVYWINAGENEFYENVQFVDTGFFDVFTFPLQKGDVRTALQDPSSVVIAKEIADKLFGQKNPIGQVIHFDNGKSLTVSGVMASLPANSSVKPTVLISMANLYDFAPWMKEAGNWYNSFIPTYLLLSPGTQAKQIEAQLPPFVEKNFAVGAKERTLRLIPFKELHEREVDNSTYIHGLMYVGIFLMLVACINFTNLSTAASLTRIREVAIRKTLGSSRLQLVCQFLTEAFLISAFSCIMGVVLARVLLPLLNDTLNLQLSMDIGADYTIAGFLLLLITTMALLAGTYPSLYFSSLQVVHGLKGKTPNQARGNSLRNGLVTIQFVIAVFLVSGTLLIAKQIHFMKHADLRFDRENVLVVDLNLGFKNEKVAHSEVTSILHELQNKPQVSSVSIARNVPGRYSENYNGFLPEGWTKEAISLRQAYVDQGYIDTYGIRVIEGRNFSASMPTDTLKSVMVNKAAMQAFGWKTAVGKTLQAKGSDTKWQVVGVMDDFHYQSLQGKVEPLIHFFTGAAKVENYSFLSLKVKPEHTASIITFLQERFKDVPSRKELGYFFIDEEFNKQYTDVERTLSLITFFTIVTILIACAGIFALTSLSTRLRTKEVGIRKVLGASIGNIVGLFFKDYIRLVLLANLIAWPLVYVAMSYWLEDFAYKIDISPWLPGAAGIITLIIALLTISYLAIKAALANPVKSLRNE